MLILFKTCHYLVFAIFISFLFYVVIFFSESTFLSKGFSLASADLENKIFM